MAIAVKRKLSGSTDGKAIKVAATATPGTLIHTAIAGTTVGSFDEVWLWAYNDDGADRTLTLEWGGVTDPDNLFVQSISFQQGPILIVPGFILQNSMVVRAFASVANVVTITGYVNQIQD